MLVRLAQLRKVLFLIKVALLGIVKLVIAQPLKALSPIEVTLSGIVMLVRPVQPENA